MLEGFAVIDGKLIDTSLFVMSSGDCLPVPSFESLDVDEDGFISKDEYDMSFKKNEMEEN